VEVRSRFWLCIEFGCTNTTRIQDFSLENGGQRITDATKIFFGQAWKNIHSHTILILIDATSPQIWQKCKQKKYTVTVLKNKYLFLYSLNLSRKACEKLETRRHSFSAEVSGQIQRRQFYPRRKSPWYPLNRKLGGSKNRRGPCRNSTTIHRLISPYTSH